MGGKREPCRRKAKGKEGGRGKRCYNCTAASTTRKAFLPAIRMKMEGKEDLQVDAVEREGDRVVKDERSDDQSRERGKDQRKESSVLCDDLAAVPTKREEEEKSVLIQGKQSREVNNARFLLDRKDGRADLPRRSKPEERDTVKGCESRDETRNREEEE